MPGDTGQDESISDAAIYARTSASKPDYHYSIDEQVTRCWNRCNQHDWDVKFVFRDEAESGTDTDRPAFQEMLQKAKLGCFDVVVFWKLDRFCRSLTDLVNTEKELDSKGVALQSVTEYIDTASPVGRFNFRNLASAAELESDLTSQRVQIGMHGMAKEHRWPNNQPPLGYTLNDDQTLEINEEEAGLVRRIFRMYLEHRSMPSVAYKLNQKEIRTKKGNEWSRVTVKKVLSNKLYRGHYQLGEYEETVPEYRILDDDLFEAVVETRYRFQHEKGEMSEKRKDSKAETIFDQFRSAKDET
jgi:site-specific DNA recombinase